MSSNNKKFDPNRVVKFEKAVAEKYGEETIQNPKAKWNHELEVAYLKQIRDKAVEEKDKVPDEMIEINGVFIPKKLVTKDSNRTCPVCGRYSFSLKDDVFMGKFGVCETCFIQHIEDREDKWEQKKKALLNSKS